MEQFIIFIAYAFVCCFAIANRPVRNTNFGKIRGKITSRYTGTDVEEYLGIPYATPPVGKLRFKRPTDPTAWRDIKETTTLPPACPQIGWYYLQTHKPKFERSNEDCLYLNIFVPRVDNTSLPVLLYIHGGSNRVGMGAMFDGDILAAHGQIIVVNFNYRLGILGFYADRDVGIEGNNGLIDQVKAMQWVHNNIHYFNGDPSKVTIHGHSAGAGDVGLHLVSDLAKGLYRYAIVHSGSPLAYWAVSDCVLTLRRRNIPPDDCKKGTSYTKTKMTYADLMSKSAEDSQFLRTRGEENPYELVNFRPVIDDYYLKESPDKFLSCQKVHAESVLLAMARDEGFPYYNKSYRIKDDHDILFPFIYSFGEMFDSSFKDNLLKVYEEWKNQNLSYYPHSVPMQSDVIFYVPMVKLADLISKYIEQVYLFSFEYVSDNLTGPGWQGVPHGWDVFYVFGAPLVGHGMHHYTERDIEVSKATMTLFSNYVKYGEIISPTIEENQKVPTYNRVERNYVKLDYKENSPVLTNENNFRGPRINFWYQYLFPNDRFTCGCDKTQFRYLYFFVLITIFVIY